MSVQDHLIDQIIQLAIDEDIQDGDVTSLSCIPENASGEAYLKAKDQGIVSGIEIAQQVVKHIDPKLIIASNLKDGDSIEPSTQILKISGRQRSILSAERIILNFMQRMSGIATITRSYCNLIDDLPTQVIDTRKTTPGNRVIEKMAVIHGGGANHRMGLYDMIMIKDNHIDYSGGIDQAISNCKAYLEKKQLGLKIEVEVRSLDDLRTVLNHDGIHRILLDNFSIEDTREAVKTVNKRIELESSGGITFESLRSYAECGVEYISVGALTHQIKSLDLSLTIN